MSQNHAQAAIAAAPDAAKGAFATAKTAMLKRIDDSRHIIMLDQPEAFAMAVDAFLAE